MGSDISIPSKLPPPPTIIPIHDSNKSLRNAKNFFAKPNTFFPPPPPPPPRLLALHRHPHRHSDSRTAAVQSFIEVGSTDISFHTTSFINTLPFSPPLLCCRRAAYWDTVCHTHTCPPIIKHPTPPLQPPPQLP